MNRFFLCTLFALAAAYCAADDFAELLAGDSLATRLVADGGDDVIKPNQTSEGKALPNTSITPDARPPATPDSTTPRIDTSSNVVPDANGTLELQPPAENVNGFPRPISNADTANPNPLNQNSSNQNPPNQNPPNQNLVPRIDPFPFVRHNGGGIVGQRLPYTSIGLFAPINIRESILFAQPQVTIDNQSDLGGGVSLGMRRLFPDSNFVFGFATSYDAQRSRYEGSLEQLVFTLEGKGGIWETVLNTYVAIGRESALSGQPTFGPVRFEGNNLVADAFERRQTSLDGIDLDIARRFTGLDLWAFGGAYHFEGGGEQTDGVKGGVRGLVRGQVKVDLTVSDDDMFGTNVGFSTTIYFDRLLGTGNTRSIARRMTQPLQRSERVNVRDQNFAHGPQALTQGGNPVTVAFVDDGGIGTGTGTTNDPLGSLIDAGGSGADVIILAADTSFNGQSITLADGQQLFGEHAGINHFVSTDQMGAVMLPRFSAGANAPMIQNAVGDAITLMGNNVVSGVQIVNAANSGINVTNAMGDTVIRDVDIFDSGGPSIRVLNPDFLLIERTNINAPFGPAVQIQRNNPGVGNVTLLNNQFLVTAGPSTFSATGGGELNINLFGNEDQQGFQLNRDPFGILRLGGSLGVGGSFNDDNGNIVNNGNTSLGLPANVIIGGAGNQIEIIGADSIPLSFPSP